MSTLATLVPLQQYRADRAHVFQRDEALRWFVRQHRSELVSSGALVLIGRRNLAEPARFDAVAYKIGGRLAAVRAGK
jgi:hypothetical protein